MSDLKAVQHDKLEPEFWAERWQTGQAFWHQASVNDALLSTVHHLDAVKAAASSSGQRPRMFVPLCGATVDMAYFISQGWHVVGLDAVEQPLREFINDHKDKLTNVKDVSSGAGIVHISADHLDLFAVDLFSDVVTPELFGGLVDAVWDRGSFVAIGVKQREAYVAKITQLLKKSDKPNWLLDSFDYNLDSAFEAPPHALPLETIDELLKAHASASEIVDRRGAPPRFNDVPGLTRAHNFTCVITISK